MSRVHHVKHAAKDYPDHGIKKGDPYFWWKPMIGGRGGSKRFSRTQPRPSQTTSSDFYSQLFSAQESVEDLDPASYGTVADFEADVQSIRDELDTLSSETQDKFDNMPDGLQQGDTGQLLETRASETESLVSEFDSLDFSEPDEDDITPTDKETKEDALARAVLEKIEELKQEIEGFNWSID